MGQVTVINKSDVPPREPIYNATDQAVSDPVEGCPLNKKKENKPVKKIIKSYFVDEDDKEIEITIGEEKVYFTIESENMIGEEVYVDLQIQEGVFKFNNQQIGAGELFKIKIEANVERIALNVSSEGMIMPPSSVSRVIQAPKPPAKISSTPPKKPLPELPAIKSVAFLDGDDVKTVSGTVDQFVNLPRDEKWVDKKTIKNIDRLSNQPRILVEFNKKGKHAFTIKFTGDPNNSRYSAAEQKRNGKFKFDYVEKNYITDDNGKKIIDNLKINVAGNNKFKVTAKDIYGKEVVSSGELSVMRFFYIQELKMKGLTSCANNLNILKNEYKRNFIALENLGEQDMDYMKNISDTDSEIFGKKIEAAIARSKGKEKAPHCLSIAYTDQLAVKIPNHFLRKGRIKVGPGEPSVVIEVKAPGKRDGDTDVKERALWNNIDEDKGWFVSCVYLYTEREYEKIRMGTRMPTREKASKMTAKRLVISEDKCTPVPISPRNPHNCKKVSIDVSALPKGEGTVILRVNVVDRMRAGLAFPGKPYVVVCTRAWWGTSSSDKQNQVAIHEIGHKIQMVTDGSGKQPDKVSTHYKDKGHVGDHCFNGNLADLDTYGTTAATKLATCVMFGSTNGKDKFCENCAPAVKKVDLSNGF